MHPLSPSRLLRTLVLSSKQTNFRRLSVILSVGGGHGAHERAGVLEGVLGLFQAGLLLFVCPGGRHLVHVLQHCRAHRFHITVPLVEVQGVAVQEQLGHLLPNHAPPGRVRKVVVVEVAHEPGDVPCCYELPEEGRVGRSVLAVLRPDGHTLHVLVPPVRQPGQVPLQGLRPLQPCIAEGCKLGCVVDQVLETLVHHLGLGQELEVLLARRLPLGEWGLSLLLPLLSLVPGVELHGI
mmetsp:Transcript_23039/g.33431  ORF Transcript_23039/g.33431 Transcript_23039/m.33431 type:complete len:237 (-) Transcript_23039:339-1049(-)